MKIAENFKPVALVLMIALALFVSNIGERAVATQQNMHTRSDPGHNGVVPGLPDGRHFSAGLYRVKYYQDGNLLWIGFDVKPAARALLEFHGRCNRGTEV